MKCPVCDNTLTEIHLELEADQNWDEVRVDACEGGCGGFWFDRFELEKVDELHEGAGARLLEIDHDPSIPVDHDVDRNCPKCDDIVMMKRFFSVNRAVELDECGGCAGLWLDAGELERVRRDFETDEARQDAFDAYFEEQFAPTLEVRETHERDKGGIRSVLKFLSPTQWFTDRN